MGVGVGLGHDERVAAADDPDGAIEDAVDDLGVGQHPSDQVLVGLGHGQRRRGGDELLHRRGDDRLDVAREHLDAVDANYETVRLWPVGAERPHLAADVVLLCSAPERIGHTFGAQERNERCLRRPRCGVVGVDIVGGILRWGEHRRPEPRGVKRSLVGRGAHAHRRHRRECARRCREQHEHDEAQRLHSTGRTRPLMTQDPTGRGRKRLGPHRRRCPRLRRPMRRPVPRPARRLLIAPPWGATPPSAR